MSVSTSGMSDSHPSIPNLFIPGYLEERNWANPLAEINLLRISFFLTLSEIL